MTKKIMGFTALGLGMYLAYKNMDKIKDVANDISNMMKKEYDELEDML